MSDEAKVNDCLKVVSAAVADGEAEVELARAALRKCETKVNAHIAGLVKDVARVVFESNSQILRQKAIRNLYWGPRVKASIIAAAFGVNEHGIHSTAGPLIEKVPCGGNCGRVVEKTYRSHSDWKSGRRIQRDLCTECKRQQDALGRIEHEKYLAQQQAEAAAYCAENGHHWGAEDINGERAENGVDWISNNRPIRLENATLVSFDNNSIVLQLFCMNWCGATMETTISENPVQPSA